MAEAVTDVAGILIPSIDPLFLAVVGVHIVIGLTCVVSGAVAMLSPKCLGRHPRYGKIYFWGLAALFTTATSLAIARWAEDYHLFIVGALAFAFAYFGRSARRGLWPQWARLHMTGMGGSYILMLTAFLVDNGKFLPVWRELPPLALWFVPSVIGLPILISNLLRHPLVRRA
jgi:uncharacterized membrane protein